MLPEQENKSGVADTSDWKETNHAKDAVLLVNQLNIILTSLNEKLYLMSIEV